MGNETYLLNQIMAVGKLPEKPEVEDPDKPGEGEDVDKPGEGEGVDKPGEGEGVDKPSFSPTRLPFSSYIGRVTVWPTREAA